MRTQSGGFVFRKLGIKASRCVLCHLRALQQCKPWLLEGGHVHMSEESHGSLRAQHCGRGDPHSKLGPPWLSLTEQSQAQAHRGVSVAPSMEFSSRSSSQFLAVIQSLWVSLGNSSKVRRFSKSSPDVKGSSLPYACITPGFGWATCLPVGVLVHHLPSLWGSKLPPSSQKPFSPLHNQATSCRLPWKAKVQVPLLQKDILTSWRMTEACTYPDTTVPDSWENWGNIKGLDFSFHKITVSVLFITLGKYTGVR